MRKVCLDNHNLIWGVRGIATPGQEQHIERAKQLFEDLDQSDSRVMIPSVVVAEFLAGVPKPQHGNRLDVLNRRFQIPPFDTRTAAVAAELWAGGSGAQPAPQGPDQRGLPRD